MGSLRTTPTWGRHVETHATVSGGWSWRSPPPGTSACHPGHQLRHLEGLGGSRRPGVEPSIFSQTGHGRSAPTPECPSPAAPLLQYAQAVATGQAEIQDDGVIGFGLAESPPRCHRGEIGDETGQTQLFRQLAHARIFSSSTIRMRIHGYPNRVVPAPATVGDEPDDGRFADSRRYSASPLPGAGAERTGAQMVT